MKYGIGIPGRVRRVANRAIVIAQMADVQIVARAYSPIVMEQTTSVSIVASAAPTSPITVCGADLLQWCRADLGVTIGTDFAWADQGAGAKHYTKLVAATGPSLTASDATLSNLATLTFNGTTQSCQSALQLPAPGTTPTFVWMIVRQDAAWELNANLISGDGGFVIRQSATTPRVRLVNGSLGVEKTQATIGTWVRMAGWVTNSTSDFLKVKGSGVADATNSGNGADATAKRSIATTPSGATLAAMTIAEIVYAKSTNYLAALDAYGAARYPAALFA